jgi:DEAD/DEAH box helicase domain-containing protein
MTRTTTSFRVLRTDGTRPVGLAQLAVGTVEVASQVTGYQRIDTRTRVTVATEALDLPPSVLRTRAIWYTVEEAVLRSAGVPPSAVPGALHAVEHAAIGILPLFAICDRWDVGGVSTALAVDTGLPTIMIYDGYPGGAGIAELAFEASDRHLGATLDVVARCPCTTGCPSCVQSPKCGNGNEPLDKAGAAALLATVLGVAVTPNPPPGA